MAALVFFAPRSDDSHRRGGMVYYLGAALGLETTNSHTENSLTGRQVNWELTARIVFI